MALIELVAKQNTGKAEMRIRVTQTKNGRNFDFILKDNSISIYPKPRPDGPDWYRDLTPKEQLQVFNYILGEYRTRAKAENNFQFAAIGITSDHDIYININTEWVANSYQRRCAEQNLVNTAFTHAAHKTRLAQTTGEEGATEVDPGIKTLYLMGGNAEGKAYAPCGDCTDLLARVMPENADIWVLPVNNGRQPLTINDTAKTSSDLESLQAWKTNIGYLNQDRMIQLDDASAKMQRDAFDKVVREITTLLSSQPVEGVDRQHMLPYSSNPIGETVFHLPHVLNRQMVSKIDDLLFKRVKRLIAKYGIAEINEANVKKLMLDHIEAVRCVVLQLDNKAIVSHVSSRDDASSAAPHTEVIARDLAQEHLGTEGIARAVVMEFNPRAIEAGILYTSPKESAERLGKACSSLTGTVHYDFIPYNDGTLSRDRVDQRSVKKEQSGILPGGHKGRHHSTLGHDCKTHTGVLRVEAVGQGKQGRLGV